MADLSALENVTAIGIDLITTVEASDPVQVVMGPPGRSIASAALLNGVLTVTFSDGSTQAAGDLKPALRALVGELYPQFAGHLGYPAGTNAAIEALIDRKAETQAVGEDTDFSALFAIYLIPVTR